MGLIIDGYNLLNATGIAGRGGGGSPLAQSRAALLDFLAERLSAEDRRTTTVVFDGRHAPPGLDSVQMHRGITVRFARPQCEADDVIEELIRRDTAPRRLTVVSSDHRLHRAARRRRATPVDSDVWFQHFARQPGSKQGSGLVSAKNPEPAAPSDFENPFPPGYGEDLLRGDEP